MIRRYVLLGVGIILLISGTVWKFFFRTTSLLEALIISSIIIGVLIAGIVVAYKRS